MDIEKFKLLCEKVAGYVGFVQQGREVAVITSQPDCGEDGAAPSADEIRGYMSECGVRGGLCPYPVHGKLSYFIRLRPSA